ncbi:MAG TPA: hypothetical protein VFS36_16050 [Chitinophagaceae bacterium]|jgi:hypothetical protein|nr:hypothetical protein [Chitinophagaceae bacterium]
MLNEKEEAFLVYWEENRLKQKKFVKYLQYGLPLGVSIGVATFINVFSGWDKQAAMVFNADPSLILVLLIAVIGIIVFVSVFTVRHRWEINEQYYQELLAKKNKQ